MLAAATVPLASNAASSARTSSVVVRVSTRTVPGLGPILVNSNRRTLYLFVPDKQKKVTCVSSCAGVWQPLKKPTGAKLVAACAAKATLLGSDPDPAGGRVVTYNGWPLYTYVADTKAGVAYG
jgi:predicted lipoprotein with Yx(FWY)xxD motif